MGEDHEAVGSQGGLLGEGAKGLEVSPKGYAEGSLARPTGEPLGRGKSLCKGLEAKASI